MSRYQNICVRPIWADNISKLIYRSTLVDSNSQRVHNLWTLCENTVSMCPSRGHGQTTYYVTDLESLEVKHSNKACSQKVICSVSHSGGINLDGHEKGTCSSLITTNKVNKPRGCKQNSIFLINTWDYDVSDKRTAQGSCEQERGYLLADSKFSGSNYR